MGRQLLFLLPILYVSSSAGELGYNSFHFGACHVDLGGIIDSFPLPASPNANEICQKACQVIPTTY